MTRLLRLSAVLLALVCFGATASAQGLNVSLAASTGAPGPGDLIDYTLVVSNTGATTLGNVRVEVRFPEQMARFVPRDVIGDGLTCPSSGGSSNCDPRETGTWAVGTLAPGQSRTIIMPTSIAVGASEGTFVLSPAIATATGSNEVILYNDILLGTEVAPTAGEADPSADLRVTPAPNPTAGPTEFLLSVPHADRVRLAVYDALGREVAVVLDGALPAGDAVVEWNAEGLRPASTSTGWRRETCVSHGRPDRRPLTFFPAGGLPPPAGRLLLQHHVVPTPPRPSTTRRVERPRRGCRLRCPRSEPTTVSGAPLSDRRTL